MKFVIDRKTLLAINRRAAEMLREMDERREAGASPATLPAPAPGSCEAQPESDLWPSATTQFSIEDIREGFRIANEKLNSIYASNSRKIAALPDEKDEST